MLYIFIYLQCLSDYFYTERMSQPAKIQTDKVRAFLEMIRPLLDGHDDDISVLDMTHDLNAISARRYYTLYLKKPVLLIAERTPRNNLAICQKARGNEADDMFVIYKNQYRTFKFNTEAVAAVDEVRKILEQ